jgi:histidinol dehydrogenase
MVCVKDEDFTLVTSVMLDLFYWELPEILGDYASGTNHTAATNGYAKN